MERALETIGGDDEMPQVYGRNESNNAEHEEMIYGDTISFYDKLKEEMSEVNLTEEQNKVMEYLIGSLDDDGLLRKSLDTISDELAIYNGIDVSIEDIEAVLLLLQTFDPAVLVHVRCKKFAFAGRTEVGRNLKEANVHCS